MMTDHQVEFGAKSREERIAEAGYMDDRNRQRVERARAEKRPMVVLEGLRPGPDGRLRLVTYLRSMASIEKAEEAGRAREDDGSGRSWQRKFFDDDGAAHYDADADRASRAYWGVREARRAECQRNKGCDTEAVPSRHTTPRPRARQTSGQPIRTRGSRRSGPSGGGGDSGNASGESDPDGDHHPPAAGEKAEKRCESCDRPFRESGRTCARCRKKQQRDRERQAKLDAEPPKPLVSFREVEAEQNYDRLVWLMETAADGLSYMATPGCYGVVVA